MQRFLSRGRLAGLGLALAGMALNPATVCRLTGRSELPPRILFVVVVAEALLVAIGLAAAFPGRVRRMAFPAIAMLMPLALLAGAEVVLTVLPTPFALEDMRIFRSWRAWPAEMMRDDRFARREPYRLYQPLDNPVVRLNSLGLRTAEPTPKPAGEWRIGLTGGSTMWGWRLADGDTIAARLQALLAQAGFTHVRVYNLGIESAVLREEVALLKDFAARYQLDEVVFYTGGNDAWGMFSTWTAYRPQARTGVVAAISDFATVKLLASLTGGRRTLPGEPAAAAPALFDAQVAQPLAQAAAYCRESGLACDLMLQPWAHHKQPQTTTERRLADNSDAAFGPLKGFVDAVYARYADQPGLPVHDLRGALDGMAEPVFGDMIHVNEAGNARIAQALFEILKPSRAELWKGR